MRRFITGRRGAVIGTTVAAALALTACAGSGEGSGSSGGGEGDLVIGSVLYGVDGYQTAHGKAMEEYGKSIGVTVRTCNSKNEVSVQNKCVQDLIAAGVDSIVLQPIDTAAATAMVKQAQAAGIGVVTWAIGPVPDVEVPWVDLAEYDQAFEAGARAAAWVKENFDQDPLIVNLSVPKNTNCENREGGFIDGATDANPATKVVAAPNGGGQRVVSQEAMSDIIQSGVDFNVVTGCNGESTIGGLLALQSAGRGEAVDKVPTSEYLFSVDGTSAELEYLLDPTTPLMEVLALTPADNVKVLLDAAVDLANGDIDNSFEAHLVDEFIPPNCEAANEFLAEQYDSSIDCK